jgi:TATA-box binding protein (TBP) (component of TFIID and TFIIIB)
MLVFMKDMIKKKKKKKEEKSKRTFYNQCTLIIKSDSGKMVNMKVFTNGKIQMTGCQNEENRMTVLKKLVKILKMKIISPDDKKIYKIVENEDDIKVTDMKLPLINTGYKTGFKIKRKELYKLLISKYDMFSMYDTDNHVGTRTRYLSSKGNIVNITVFRTGSILVASNDMECIKEGYDNINKIFKDNFDEIVKIDKVIDVPKGLKNLKRLEYNNDKIFYIIRNNNK